MTAPPSDLMQWPKGKLAAEVARLRAILHEHAEQPADEPTSGGDIVDVAGDQHARGGVVLDTRHAVLMDAIDVSLVDRKSGEPPAMALLLQGRVNLTNRRTRQLFLLGPDGAAGLVTELIELAYRAGGEFAREFKTSFDRRTTESP